MSNAKKPKNKGQLEPSGVKTSGIHWHHSDLVAAAKLATQATISVTHLVEEVHQSVLGTMGFEGKAGGTSANQASKGMTGLVYDAVRTITHWVGGAIDTGYNLAQPLLAKAEGNRVQAHSTREREAVLAALNGVVGDRLASAGNPLATPMRLRYQGQVLDLKLDLKLDPRFDPMFDSSKARSDLRLERKWLVVIHGLCMNDLQWTHRIGKANPVEHNHAEMLAKTFGYIPIYLRYNTGLSISENGRDLSNQLEILTKTFPEMKELSVLAHSMGGLLIRSAISQAAHQETNEGEKSGQPSDWRGRLGRVVFLGTPHHGAPLERAGQWVDILLGSTPFSAPFKRLTQLRSAGITDLRYGHLTADHRPLPLPEGVACFSVAATTAAKRSVLADRLLGDGLVPLNSALGIHKTPGKSLYFPKERQRIFYKMNHMELLSRPEVAEQLLEWFRD